MKARHERNSDGFDETIKYGSIGKTMRKVTECIKKERKDGTNLSGNSRRWNERGQRKP